MKRHKLCLIYNFAPKYREGIFRLIDQEYDCDWFFGNNSTDIKGLDLSILKNVTVIKNQTVIKPPLYYQKGVLSLLKNDSYFTYFMLGDVNCLSTWLFIVLKHIVRPKKKIFFWTHGWYGKEGFPKKALKKFFFRLVDGIFLYGNYAKAEMIKEGFDSNKLHVIKNSLDYDRQLKLRNNISSSNIYKKHFNNANPVIIFIGRLTAVKKLDQLLKAVILLKQKGENYNTVFVGDGEMRSELEAEVMKYQLQDNVWFYGTCFDEKINAELIFNADLCVAPGNIGLTAMHALMFGCPAISHNDFRWQMPEFESIKPGITGDFFEYNNVEDLAQTISKWFDSKKDSREDVRQACYKEIDSYWNPHYQLNLLKKVLGI